MLSASPIINAADGKAPADGFTPEAALDAAMASGEKTFDLLLRADALRRQHKAEEVFTCGIVNAKSGKCSENCAFCAQSGHHRTRIEIYPFMSEEAIIESALAYAGAGASNFSMVASGLRMSEKELDTVCRAVDTIRRRTGLSVCASLGTLTTEMATALKQGGVTNYHHNLETARSHFDAICTTHAYDDDIETIRTVQSAGMRICSGGIMGLGETWAQRIELAFTLKELDVDSIPVNFLNPIPGTPLENRPLLSPMEALKCVALYRLINPEKDIVICGGREVTLGDFQSWVFLAGANGLMIGNYLTTQGRKIGEDMTMIRDLGLKNRQGPVPEV